MDPITIAITLGIAAIGGFLGVGSYIDQTNNLNKDLKNQIGRTEESKQLDLELADLQYKEAEKQALKNANTSDKQSTFTETLASVDFNNNLDALQMQQEAQAYNDNIQQMQASQTTANALSNMATSGTRNSSMNEAVELEASLNAEQMQLQQNQTRKSGELNLSSLGNSFFQTTQNIQNARTEANELRTSFSEGGYQQQLYEKQRTKITNSYDNALEDLKDAKADTEDFWKNLLGGATAFFGGAQQGYNYGTTLSELATNLQGAKQTYDTGINLNALKTYKSSGYDFFNNLDTYNFLIK